MYKISAIPAFRDNYIWAIHLGDNKICIIDPGQAPPVNSFLEQHQLQLCSILITHCHYDHIGGVKDLYRQHNCKIIGPSHPELENCTTIVTHGDRIELENDLYFNVLHTPGHAAEHMIYFNDTTIFTGDTLFTGGCGRAFQSDVYLYESMQQLKALPPQLMMYCAHEYTLDNLHFAIHVEPENRQLQQRLADVTLLRQQNQVTACGTLQTELDSNPFLRTNQPSVIDSIDKHYDSKTTNEQEIFQKLRRWKDLF